MASAGTKYVGPEGPSNAQVMIVGEAPGRDEHEEGRPFVGKSGQLLERYLERLGERREDVFLTNLCRYRPPSNKFVQMIGSDELEAGLAELEAEIEEVNPNVIIALGEHPLQYLTGLKGIGNYRGSILRSLERWGTRKVIACYHPAYILRDWDKNPIFYHDLSKAINDQHFPELNYPVYRSHINPDADELSGYIQEAAQADWCSVDIETFPTGTFSCIGFCWSDSAGVCVTFERPDLHHIVRDLWEGPSRKIFQFGTYDHSFMKFFYGWDVGGWWPEGDERGLSRGGWDTYIAAANLNPSFPKGLGFLASIYTRFPYYKAERKVWKEENDMNILWEYNIKDIIATYQVAMAQMKELS